MQIRPHTSRSHPTHPPRRGAMATVSQSIQRTHPAGSFRSITCSDAPPAHNTLKAGGAAPDDLFEVAVDRHPSIAVARAARPRFSAAGRLLLAMALLILAAACRRHQAPSIAETQGRRQAFQPLPAGMKTAVNHACELLTRDDAEALLGGAVKPPIAHVEYGTAGKVSARCGYVSVAGPPAKVVSLLLIEHKTGEETRAEFEHAHAMSQTISGQAAENVPGLGDRAYWAGGIISQLNVLSGNRWLVISGTRGLSQGQLAAAHETAARILAAHPAPS